MTLLDELALAQELADLADAITLPLYRSETLNVGTKANNTEVTEADLGAEAAIRSHLAAARPDHAVLGEEEGLIGASDAAWRWVIDPIDGTSNFVKGFPGWATLIALTHKDRPVVGLVSAPALGRRWWAAAGHGAFANGSPINVSAIDTIGAAHLSHAGVANFLKYGSPEHQGRIVALCNSVWRERGIGDFWMHMLVAEGVFDIAVEPIVSVWDLAALQPIVEEAGGRFTNFAGEARPDGGSALSTNSLLHDAVLKALAGA